MACRDWYQPGALLASEEGVIIAGLLVGLNTIDYNVVMKGEDFDKPVRIDMVQIHVFIMVLHIHIRISICVCYIICTPYPYTLRFKCVHVYTYLMFVHVVHVTIIYRLVCWILANILKMETI